MSGAAVFCQGFLTGVVFRDDEEFGNRRLYAVPAQALTADLEFTRLITEDTGAAPVLEAVEFEEFLQPPSNPTVLARTPGSLLAAAVEVVGFTGRGGELEELTAWRDSTEGFSVMLVTGEGGQGKTRLASEFASRSRQAGWACGFLRARIYNTSGSDTEHLQSMSDLAKRLRRASRPVLLAVDYAETRPEEIAAIADALVGAPLSEPVRFLLLSRTAGAWWTNLTDAIGQGVTGRIKLGPLTDTGEDRLGTYAAAVTGLARHLEALPEPPVEQPPHQPWAVLAERLAQRPPGLDDPSLGNALTLQITALTDLLALATGRRPARLDRSEERELVRHERGYLQRAAAKRALFRTSVLSDLADEDERKAEAWAALERALAAAILLGPCDASRARAIGALTAEARAVEVVNWLAAMYPPPDEHHGIGTVQPDRLAELLLGPILIKQAHLLSQIAALTTMMRDAYAILFVLVRTASHPEFGQIGAQTSDLIAARPLPFAVAAPVLAATMPQAVALQEGLFLLGLQDPQAFKSTAYEAARQLPESSLSLAFFSAYLTAVLTSVLRRLAEDIPALYLPDLGSWLTTHAARLAGIGQRQEALTVAQDAVAIRRQLVQYNPDSYLPDLAGSLTNLGNLQAETAQRQAALACAQEAADIYGQLADEHPDAYLFDHAKSLTNLANRLGEIGRWGESLAPARKATSAFSQLAKENPDAYLPYLATSLNTLATRLFGIGQLQEALNIAYQVVIIRRKLAQDNPDAYLPELAGCLRNLALMLAEAGQQEAALTPTREAVSALRQLVEDNPDAYLPDLARSLDGLAEGLASMGQRQTALARAREAVTICRQLVQDDPVAYSPDLATSLITLAARFAEMGQQQEALANTKEAVTIRRRLAQETPSAYLADLAGSLNNLGVLLADTGQREAALVPAREAVAVWRQLAHDDPAKRIRGLGFALHNLADRLVETGRGDEVGPLWESAIAELPQSSRPDLTVRYAHYLLDQPDTSEGVNLLVKVLTTPGISGRVQEYGRRLLRKEWHKQPGHVKHAWQSASSVGMPSWINLADDDVGIVISWINAGTWAHSHSYFQRHAGKLLAPSTSVVLDELALTGPAELIDQHRALLDQVREHGLDSAYRRISLTPILRDWMETPNWTASCTFLQSHPMLLSDDVTGILAELEAPDSAILLHQAILALVKVLGGVKDAYRCLDDVHALEAMISVAIADQDVTRISLYAVIESFVYMRLFSGSLHTLLAWVLTGPSTELPEDLAAHLNTLIPVTDKSERGRAIAEFNAAIVHIPIDKTVASWLRQLRALRSDT